MRAPFILINKTLIDYKKKLVARMLGNANIRSL